MSFKDGVMEFVPEYEIKNPKTDVVVECHGIELYEPRHSNTSAYRSVKQIIARLFKSVQLEAMEIFEASGKELPTKEESAKKADITQISEKEHEKIAKENAEQLAEALAASKDTNILHEFIVLFKKMICSYDPTQKPVAKINGVNGLEAFTPRYFEALDPEDQERMAFEYCAFFRIGSIGKMMTGSPTAPIQPTEVKEL